MAGLLVIPGTCSECGCTEDEPCINPITDATCYWTDITRTLCSSCAGDGED